MDDAMVCTLKMPKNNSSKIKKEEFLTRAMATNC